jgi:diguanylate cyclase (GGDEF)-like protein
LDFFKRINDTYGHPAGYEVLKSVTIALSVNLRGSDKLGRYGGEEFLLLLPGSTKEDSIAVVDRLRHVVAALDWTAISKNLRVIMSAGVTQVRPHETSEEALSRAISPYTALKMQVEIL